MRTSLTVAVLLVGFFVIQTATMRQATSEEKPAVVKWEYGVLTIPPDHPDKGAGQLHTWRSEKEAVISGDWEGFAGEMKIEIKDKNTVLLGFLWVNFTVLGACT